MARYDSGLRYDAAESRCARIIGGRIDCHSSPRSRILALTTLTIYYDYTDPWCYIALYRARWLKSETKGLVVQWHPFELRPELPAHGARPQNPAFLRRKIQYDIDLLARELGVTIRVPDDRVTNSRLALEGSLYARAVGSFDAYHHAIFRGFFEQRRDIGNLDTVVELASEANIDADAMRCALAEHRFIDHVARLRAEAVDLGVAAIPTFVTNQSAVVGIVADDKLLRLVSAATPTAINLQRVQDHS